MDAAEEIHREHDDDPGDWCPCSGEPAEPGAEHCPAGCSAHERAVVTVVYCVILHGSVDNVYLFGEQDQAKVFAEPYGDAAIVATVPLLGHRAAAKVIEQDRASWL